MHVAMEDQVTEEAPHGCVVSVHCKASATDTRHVGVVVYDAGGYSIRLGVVEDSVHYGSLESLLLQLNAGTCYVSISNADTLETRRLEAVCTGCGSQYVEKKTQAQTTREAVETLLSVVLRNAGDLKEFFRDLCDHATVLALSGLFEGTGIHTKLSCKGQCRLERLKFEEFVRLDAATYNALNLFDRVGPAEGGADVTLCTPMSRSNTCLYGVLNKTRTTLGARRLLTWIRQPSKSHEEVMKRLDMVEIFVENDLLRRDVQLRELRKMRDLDKIAQRFHTVASHLQHNPSFASSGTKAERLAAQGLQDMYKLYESLSATAAICVALRRYSGTHERVLLKHYLVPIEEILEDMAMFTTLVEKSLDVTGARERHEYLVNCCLDPVLKDLAQRKKEILAEMEELRCEAEDDLENGSSSSTYGRGRASTERGQAAVKLMDGGQGAGYVLRVTKKDQPRVQRRSSKYRQVRINKAEYQFTTVKLASLNDELTNLGEEYRVRELRVALKAVGVASTYWPVVQRLAAIVAEVDVLCGFAVAANTPTKRYVRPHMVPGGSRIILKNSRHPVIEAQALARPLRAESDTAGGFGEGCVPNDIYMDREKSRLQIVTGPNMGGKSTYIRQAALIILMAQIGSFVPCSGGIYEDDLEVVPSEEEKLRKDQSTGKKSFDASAGDSWPKNGAGADVVCEIPYFDAILCRVGASDVQLRGISTFLVEMTEASAILKMATENSFVIVDELGRGTSTSEGFGIAWEVARHLMEVNRCFAFFATHFHEIVELAFAYERGVINKYVAVDLEQKKSLESDSEANDKMLGMSDHLAESEADRLRYLENLIEVFGEENARSYRYYHGHQNVGDVLRFKHRIKDGFIDKSYGVHIASITKMPASIIEDARNLSRELELVQQSMLGEIRAHRRKRKELAANERTGAEAEDHLDASTLKAEGEAVAADAWIHEDVEEKERRMRDGLENIKKALREAVDSVAGQTFDAKHEDELLNRLSRKKKDMESFITLVT